MTIFWRFKPLCPKTKWTYRLKDWLRQCIRWGPTFTLEGKHFTDQISYIWPWRRKYSSNAWLSNDFHSTFPTLKRLKDEWRAYSDQCQKDMEEREASPPECRLPDTCCPNCWHDCLGARPNRYCFECGWKDRPNGPVYIFEDENGDIIGDWQHKYLL